MIGYHAKSGTQDAIFSHTWIPEFKDVRINGQSVPEPSLNTFLSGDMGVPVIMLSGDNMVAIESSPVLGDIEYVELKELISTSEGRHKPIDEARRLLREAAKRAVSSAKKRQPVALKGSVTIEVDVSYDAINDPAPGQGPEDNITFIDGAFDGRGDALIISEFELTLRNNTRLKSYKEGTVIIETATFT